MSDKEIERIITEYLRRTARLLPNNFETEDLLEEIKAHIYEGLKYKQQIRPSESSTILVHEVLNELGTPEEIAEEYGKERAQAEDPEKDNDRFQYYLVRLVAAFVVAILAAWVVSTITEGAVDFYFAVIVLVAFAIIEWFVRAKQSGESRL
ncbi:MAG: hypothetical protein E4H14_08690 [Candidatus Thorarchaeota archaeon]|nr:MAG: hypothetical protein E4H14_08690 [Candidatus Thorarchaeota archaeon]